MSPILALETEFSKEALSGYPHKYLFKLDNLDNLSHLIEKISTSSIVFNVENVIYKKENRVSILDILKRREYLLKKFVVAHPAQQHSYKIAEALIEKKCYSNILLQFI